MTDTGWTFGGFRVIESENAPDPNGIKHLGTISSDCTPFLSRIVNTCDLHGAIYDATDPMQNMRAAYDYHTRRSVNTSKERTMTTLFKPVLIESADLPMDKFPEGTIATHPDYWPVERCSCSRWESEGEDRYDPDMIGWTALVPIEAEEQHVAPDAGTYTRYVTAWEEA